MREFNVASVDGAKAVALLETTLGPHRPHRAWINSGKHSRRTDVYVKGPREESFPPAYATNDEQYPL